MDNEQIKSFIRRWGPDILSGLATIGVGVTAFLSGRAAVKATKKSNKKDKAKCYIPTAISGVLTVASIWGSRKLSASQLASIVGAAGYLASKRKKVAELTTAQMEKPVSVEETGNGDILCLEAFSGRWFRSSVEAVEEACRSLDDIYHHGFEEKGFSSVSLNELYSLLGIQTTFFGEKVFWSNDVNGEHIVYANYFTDWGEYGQVYILEPIEESYPTMGKIDY